MLRKTAVVQKRNLLGKRIRGYLPIGYTMGMDRDELLNHIEAGWMLPIAGGTTAQNQTMQGASYFPRALVVTTDQTINQGDCVWWDPVNYTLKPATTAAQVAVGTTGGFCGVAGGGNVPGVYPNPPSGVSENLPGIVVQRGGSVRLNLQANDVVDYPFQLVTLCGVDAQTITKGLATSSNNVGYAIVPPPVTPRGAPGATPVPETVAGGASIEVWLAPKFPSGVAI